MKNLHPDELEELYTSVTSRFPRMLSSLAANLGYYSHGEYADMCNELRLLRKDTTKGYWETVWENVFTFLWLILIIEGYEK